MAERPAATAAAAVVLLAGLAAGVGVLGAAGQRTSRPDPARRIGHIVVIYEENHSFDNLWGGWPGADSSGTQDGCGRGPSRCDLHSVVDTEGMPGATPLYRPDGTVRNSPLTEAAGPDGRCRPSYAGAVDPPPGTVCGDFAVNTIQPAFRPWAPGTVPARRLPPLTTATIGDRLTAAGRSWAWYGGGWANAAGVTTSAGWTNGPGPACADPQARADSSYPYCPDTRF